MASSSRPRCTRNKTAVHRSPASRVRLLPASALHFRMAARHCGGIRPPRAPSQPLAGRPSSPLLFHAARHAAPPPPHSRASWAERRSGESGSAPPLSGAGRTICVWRINSGRLPAGRGSFTYRRRPSQPGAAQAVGVAGVANVAALIQPARRRVRAGRCDTPSGGGIETIVAPRPAEHPAVLITADHRRRLTQTHILGLRPLRRLIVARRWPIRPDDTVDPWRSGTAAASLGPRD